MKQRHRCLQQTASSSRTSLRHSMPFISDSVASFPNSPPVPTLNRLKMSPLKQCNRPVSHGRSLSGIAVTQGPGLAGALLVGVNYAKALAYALNIPVVGVSHLEGHIASAWLQDPTFPLPCVVLVVSGGHTHLYYKEPNGHCRLLGATRDDAAGEAFDKGAQMLGLEYPGGPAIDRLARQGNPDAIAFPRSYLKKGSLDFSFSGLKTALLYTLQAIPEQSRTARAR